MTTRFKYSINHRAVQLALPSIIIGTIGLLVLKNHSNTGLVGIGYFLALVAGIANGLMLLPLLVNTFRRIRDYREHLTALILILVNIPISGTYLEIL